MTLNRKGTVIDLHIHTTKGSYDSSLTPEELVKEAKRIGLDGVCITEHGGIWDRHELERFASQLDILVVRGMEINTDLGHIVVFGLDRYMSGIHRARDMRRAVEDAGGFMIAVHPFRRALGDDGFSSASRREALPTVEEAAELPIFGLVDEIEILNGACNDFENFFALQVAKKLGMVGTGGSDAHSTNGVGCFTTVFERQLRTQEEFIHELRTGRFYAAEGLLNGELIPYSDGVTDLDWLQTRIGL